MAAESPQNKNKNKIWLLFGRKKPVHEVFGREKPAPKVLGGAKPAGVFPWRINKIWTGLVVWQTTVCDLFMLHGCLVLSQICHCFVTVLYLWPTNFISKIAPHSSELTRKVFAVLREINRGLAEINRCLAEFNRCLAEINRGVAVLRGIASGRCLKKFVIALFLMYICNLYFSSPPHIPHASVAPQASITKDLIVNITIYLRDAGGFVVRREFVCHIAIVLR